MALSNLLFSPTSAFYLALPLGLLGAVIWWLLRKRQVRVWLPTVRVLDLETRLLPKLLFRPPPILKFLVFILSVAALVMLTLKPRQQVFTPFEPNQTQLHIFFDMSPSVSAQLNSDEYAQRAAALFSSLQSEGRVSVSTSHSRQILEPENAADLEKTLKRLGYHRAGVRLGTILKDQLEVAGKVNRLFIFSDRDQHSWAGFNWSYLLTDMDVLHVDVTRDTTSTASAGDGRNVFINDARYLAAPGAATMEWDVDVVRGQVTKQDDGFTPGDVSRQKPEIHGTLSAQYRGEDLALVDWVIAAGAERSTVHVNWPESKLKALGAVPDNSESSASVVDESDSSAVSASKMVVSGVTSVLPLVWQIHVAEEQANQLALDDEFRVEVRGVRQDVLLISESASERPLEDPAHQLEVVLQVLGFRVKRHDFTAQPGPRADAYPLWIIVGGSGRVRAPGRSPPEDAQRAEGGDTVASDAEDSATFCPASLQQERLAAKNTQGAIAPGRRWPRVWLVPFQSDADYEELCACYAKILLSDDEKAGAPAYCKHVQSRAGWTELLPSLGATQIGGELGDQAASLAWLGRDQNRRKSGGSSQGSLSVLAFTVPLRPSRATGITHAQLPLLVKELLIWQGLLPPGPGGNTGAKANANSAIWPRYDDINSLWAASAGEGLGSSTSGGSRDVAKNLSPDLLLKLKQSNVPLGESLMASAPTSQLPPRWTTQMAVAERQSPAKKEREDPLPWLQLLTALVLIAAGTEAVAAITARLLRATRRPVAQAGSTATVQGEAQL